MKNFKESDHETILCYSYGGKAAGSAMTGIEVSCRVCIFDAAAKHGRLQSVCEARCAV